MKSVIYQSCLAGSSGNFFYNAWKVSLQHVRCEMLAIRGMIWIRKAERHG